jgi:hypothetical protein
MAELDLTTRKTGVPAPTRLTLTSEERLDMKHTSAGSLVGKWVEVEGHGIGQVTDIHRSKVHLVKSSRHTVDFSLNGEVCAPKRLLLQRNKWKRNNGGKPYKLCSEEVASKYEDCKMQGFSFIGDYELMIQMGLFSKDDFDRAMARKDTEFPEDVAPYSLLIQEGSTISERDSTIQNVLLMHGDDEETTSDGSSGGGGSSLGDISVARAPSLARQLTSSEDDVSAPAEITEESAPQMADKESVPQAAAAEPAPAVVADPPPPVFERPKIDPEPTAAAAAESPRSVLGMPKTGAEQRAVAEISRRLKADRRLYKSMMQNAAPHEGETQLIIRFLRGSKGKVEDTLKLIQKDVAWREEKNVLSYRTSPGRNTLGCEPSQLKTLFPHGFLGYDKFRRPVLYKNYGRFLLSKLKPFTDWRSLIDYDIWLTERAVSMMGPDAVQLAMIVDMKGVTMSMLTPSQMKYVKGLAEAASPHYPERMGQVMIINAPKVFLRS